MLAAIVQHQQQVDRRVTAHIESTVGDHVDTPDHIAHARIIDLGRCEVRERRRLAHQRIRHAVGGAELRIDPRVGPHLERMADEPMRVWRQSYLGMPHRGGGQLQIGDHPQRQLGDALGDAATGILLEHDPVQVPVAAQAMHHLFGREGPAAVQVRIPVMTGEEILRPGDAARGHPRALHPGLGHPALQDTHAERAVDMALEAATAAVECQRQRMQCLPRVETQHACGGCSGRKHHRHPGRIEAVVLRLAQIETRADLGPGGQRRKEVGPGTSAGQLGGGQRRREQGGTEMRPRCHRIAVIERAAQRAIELSRGLRRQAVAKDKGGRLGLPACLEQHLAQRLHAVFGRTSQAGPADGQHHALHHPTRRLGYVRRLQFTHPAGKQVLRRRG